VWKEKRLADVSVYLEQSEVPVSAILHPPLSPTNLYFLSIMRIHQVKRGPFHEHSSQLYAIATGVATWRKVNSGLFKMYEVRQSPLQDLNHSGFSVIIRQRSSENAW
jgi:hypothetical protein